MKIKYLPGLNSLRFFAAFFVVIAHGNISLDKLGICPASNLALLNRGEDAVDFFFTLSGFLITYLLICELDTTGTISIRQFYLRRVCRIWPLYFLIVAFGFFLLGYVYPRMYHREYFTFSIPEGLALFVFFLPNYAAKNFPVGLMHPLWSIGVEEQFYLFWAPMIKLCRKHLRGMIVSFVGVTTLFYIILDSGTVAVPANMKMFLLTQKFYAMAIGSIFGYVLFHKFETYNNSIFASRLTQWTVLLIVLWHYCLGGISDSLGFKILLSILYGLLILSVAAASRKLVSLEIRGLSHLGVISYGIYMYHMPVDYLLRMTVPRLASPHLPTCILVAVYYVSLIIGAVLVAELSYRYFEKFFLNLKDRLHVPDRAVAQ